MPPNGPEGTISINESAPYNYGDTLTFTTTDNIKGSSHPMVAVHLFQNNELVWVQLNTPDQAVILGDGGSGLDPSQPASGTATLYSYGSETVKEPGQPPRRQQTITELDSVEFDAVP